MTVTAFLGNRRIAQGDRPQVQHALETGYASDLGAIRVFDDADGRVVDLDYWDAARLHAPKGRGRPSLGVRAREVTLLPQQWDWLARQPGGASAALRRLVEDARRKAPDNRARQDAVYAFMRDTCGDRSNYEEALRALYRGDAARFEALIADWPADIRGFIARLGAGL
jgi:hypothetical protein